MTKQLTRFLCVVLLTNLSLFSALSNASPAYPRDAFLGGGFTFGSHLFLGQVQSGLGFSILQKNKFSLQLGPLLGANFGKAGFFLDIDAFARASYRFNLNESPYFITAYGKVPLGYSLYATGGGIAFVHHGMNFGIVPGAQFNFHQQVGVFAELGFFHRVLFPGYGTKALQIPAGVFLLGASYQF